METMQASTSKIDLAEDSINLRALKNIDGSIQKILMCGGQVAVYLFDTKKSEWVRKNIEGTFFLVHRFVKPEYSFVVINRLDTINFVQHITKHLDVIFQKPNLLYRNREKEIYCIWFYEEPRSLIVYQKILNILQIPGNQNDQQQDGAGRSHSPKSARANSNPSPIAYKNLNDTSSQILKRVMGIDKNGIPANVSAPEPIPISAPNETLKEIFESKLNLSNSGDVASSNAEHNKSELRLSKNVPTENKSFAGVDSKFIPFASISSESPLVVPSNNFNWTKKPNPMMFTTMMTTQGDSNQQQQQSVMPTINPTPIAKHRMYLTMEELKKTLIYLLSNDADFLHSIHTAYVNNVKNVN